MMQGENIICFAKDWNEVPTSNNHIMGELAKGNRVLWLNSVATRTPSFTSKRDLGKIVRKLFSFFRGAREVKPNLWVYTPLVLPFPHSKIAIAINKRLLRLSVWTLRRKLKMRTFQLWSFLPNVGEYFGTLDESISVYFCTDEWSSFSYVNSGAMAQADRDVCRRANLVFTTAQSLLEARRPFNSRVVLSRHGVDHKLFAGALSDEVAVPADLAAIGSPVLAFFGSIQDWLDLDLLEYLAKRNPAWQIVLIGRVRVDVSQLRGLPNVHILGHREHRQLPAYCKGFSVGLIPQKVNELTVHMNPIKLREYLSAGLPVVATALPEVAAYGSLCRVAHSYQEFEQAVTDFLASDSPAMRRQRSDAMRDETWQNKVDAISIHVMQAKEDLCVSR